MEHCSEVWPRMSGLEPLVVISWHLGPGSKALSSLLMSKLKNETNKRYAERAEKECKLQ